MVGRSVYWPCAVAAPLNPKVLVTGLKVDAMRPAEAVPWNWYPVTTCVIDRKTGACPVTKLHDVEQSLSFPRSANCINIVNPVTRYRSRPDTRASAG